MTAPCPENCRRNMSTRMTRKGWRTDFWKMSLNLNLLLGTSDSGISESSATRAWRSFWWSVSKSCKRVEYSELIQKMHTKKL